MKRVLTFAVLFCLWSLFSIEIGSAQMYTVTDLGTLGGSWSQATGINASGQVVGTSEFLDAEWGPLWHAFRTEPNSAINSATDDLNPPPPCSFTKWLDICLAAATDINDIGQVVGVLRHGSADDQPFRTSAVNRPLLVPDDIIVPFRNGQIGMYDGAIAYGINNSGQAVGWWLGNCGAFRSDVTLSGPVPAYDLGTLNPARCSNSAAYGINDSGQVVGQSGNHAFRTSPNQPIDPTTDDLGTLGGVLSAARRINAVGQVVGWANLTGDESSHAFRTGPNLPINRVTDDLGTLGGKFSSATDINDFGQVVGWSTLEDEAIQHAFIYDGSVIYDLNLLVAANSTCALVGTHSPTPFSGVGASPAINNAGQIAANLDCDGLLHAVRLDPIFSASVQPPVDADGTSVFKSSRGAIPVKFTLRQNGLSSCDLPAATISIVRTMGAVIGAVDESEFISNADTGSNFRIDSCQYVYNLSSSSLGVGIYRVEIRINGIMVGHAVFALK